MGFWDRERRAEELLLNFSLYFYLEIYLICTNTGSFEKEKSKKKNKDTRET
ncbi:hypothetical protein BofuT4_uP152470.1 [Botrytis cinerea T4]|uniref:Uncharacterized protein n=1 Tax=Botryotinia fuckeliana (strain T4) TaxID=999810 RepID=G2YVN7_BOTF4|nr:hypothetical protein BofuT4_uP152470.1 [Botrytis cinerea T4]